MQLTLNPVTFSTHSQQVHFSLATAVPNGRFASRLLPSMFFSSLK